MLAETPKVGVKAKTREEAERMMFADTPKTTAKRREADGLTSRVRVREFHDKSSEARTEAHTTEMSRVPCTQRLRVRSEIRLRIGRGCWVA